MSQAQVQWVLTLEYFSPAASDLATARIKGRRFAGQLSGDVQTSQFNRSDAADLVSS